MGTTPEQQAATRQGSKMNDDTTKLTPRQEAVRQALEQITAISPLTQDGLAAYAAILDGMYGEVASRKYAQGRHDAMASLYGWLASEAGSLRQEAEDNESAANLDKSAGPAYMADGLIHVRARLRSLDKSLAREAIDNI